MALTLSRAMAFEGAMERVEISMHKGCLSQAEIERMVKVAEKFKAEDEEHRKRLEARNELETYAYKLRKVCSQEELKCIVL